MKCKKQLGRCYMGVWKIFVIHILNLIQAKKEFKYQIRFVLSQGHVLEDVQYFPDIWLVVLCRSVKSTDPKPYLVFLKLTTDVIPYQNMHQL